MHPQGCISFFPPGAALLTIGEIVGHAEKLAPPRLAREGDPGGLQVGSPARRTGRAMVALDASPDTVRQAIRRRAGLLITHHPLFFHPLSAVDPGRGEGRALALALSRDLAVYCAHTNLDAAVRGMNHPLADLLGLEGCAVLEPSPCRLCKVAVFVPRGRVEPLREALFAAGGGAIGAYDRCSFSVTGEGSFRPGPGTSPFLGRAGREQRVEEERLEAVVEERSLAPVLAAIRAAHPYEEPAIDVVPLRSVGVGEGIGLCGDLRAPVACRDLAEAVMNTLRLSRVRTVGDMRTRVKRVAVCTGSGGSLLEEAIRSGARFYLTGDLGYHAARRAQEAGVVLCDPGHFAPERLGMERFARRLAGSLRTAGSAVEVVMAREDDPFSWFAPARGGEGVRTVRRRRT
jgi:dinuclear metal center YbgI/SA1388 family protein